MCKPGEPCPGAENAKPSDTYSEFMTRLEMIVIGIELYQKHDVQIPKVTINLFNLIGPILMTNLGKSMGWTDLELASHVMRERRRVYVDQGIPLPDKTPMERVLDLVAEIKQQQP
jgi:hypothetical protein